LFFLKLFTIEFIFTNFPMGFLIGLLCGIGGELGERVVKK
jgi:hypothetical protein